MNAYLQKLTERIAATGSCLCVGLDPRPERHGGDPTTFLRRIIDQTSHVAAAFKPNAAFFESMGPDGVRLLEQLRGWIAEDIPLVLDVKRGDIGETQKYYARACFDRCGADAVTLNPYMGRDSLQPFRDYADRGAYLLGITSNPGAADIQQQRLADGRRVFEVVAAMAGEHDGTGLVVGLTQAGDDEMWRRLPDLPLLVPGFGAQGGELDGLKRRPGSAPVLVNVSRGVLYPGPDKDPAQAAEEYATLLTDIARHA